MPSPSSSRSYPSSAAMDPSPEDRRSPRVGLAYDERMCRHSTPDGESHPENPERIRAIWRKLEAEGIPERCILLKIKEAKDAIIASVHTMNHINLIRNISSKEFDSRRLKIASKLDSIYFNDGSSEAAYLATGSVIEATEKVAKGDLDSAIAVVRPPGHHAEANEAMGFCLFNNVAIAASYLLNEREKLGIRRILIVDWDVHHGNGTQNMFYNDPRVLYFSVHRFDFGSFYPTGGDGSHCMIGEDQGAGYNINVPWEHGQCGDADYLAVWYHILVPVVESYNPDIILISAGFDAAMGDPLGGCCLTPYGYSLMLERLMKFADGKIVLALEGGYNLNSLANSVLACAKTLLEGNPIVGNLEGKPFESTWRLINEVRHELKTYWPVFSLELPQDILIAHAKPYPIQRIGIAREARRRRSGLQTLEDDLGDHLSDVEAFLDPRKAKVSVHLPMLAPILAEGVDSSKRCEMDATDCFEDIAKELMTKSEGELCWSANNHLMRTWGHFQALFLRQQKGMALTEKYEAKFLEERTRADKLEAESLEEKARADRLEAEVERLKTALKSTSDTIANGVEALKRARAEFEETLSRAKEEVKEARGAAEKAQCEAIEAHRRLQTALEAPSNSAEVVPPPLKPSNIELLESLYQTREFRKMSTGIASAAFDLCKEYLVEKGLLKTKDVERASYKDAISEKCKSSKE